MDRTAVFVDAGYLFAAGSRLIANERLPRGELALDHDALLRTLQTVAHELSGLPLLRVYWYDGTAGGPTAQQLALAYQPNLKLRLGSVNQYGQQKGVDSLIILDLLTLARNHAMADAVLLSGDEDLRLGVLQAQEFGVRVHLLGIAPARENQSGLLVQEADGSRELSLEEVQAFLSRALPATSGELDTPAGWAARSDSTVAHHAALELAAQRLAGELSADELHSVRHDAPIGSVPGVIDRRLLVAGSQALGGQPLSPEQKRALRNALLDACMKSAG